MPNDTSAAGLNSAGGEVEAVAPQRVPVRERMIVEQDPVTGVRLKVLLTGGRCRGPGRSLEAVDRHVVFPREPRSSAASVAADIRAMGEAEGQNARGRMRTRAFYRRGPRARLSRRRT